MSKNRILIIILSSFLVGALFGNFTKTEEWSKQEIEEYQSYCEEFWRGKFSSLNNYPICFVDKIYK